MNLVIVAVNGTLSNYIMKVISSNIAWPGTSFFLRV